VVEHDLAKVGVEGSNPFARSNFSSSKLEIGPSESFPGIFRDISSWKIEANDAATMTDAVSDYPN
jgi:hypothetical protein